MCSSIAWQQSEKARLKEIEDKRREADAAKAAELQKAAAASTTSVHSGADVQELMVVALEDFPVAFSVCKTNDVVPKINHTSAITSFSSLNSVADSPPLNAESAFKSEMTDAPRALPKLHTADSDVDQPTTSTLPFIKSDNHAQLSKAVFGNATKHSRLKIYTILYVLLLDLVEQIVPLPSVKFQNQQNGFSLFFLSTRLPGI